MSLPPGYDRRLTPANGRVAAAELEGRIEAARHVQPALAQVSAPLADLLNAPGGRRERQLLMGWVVEVFERRDGYAFVRSPRDGHVGYVPEDVLAEPVAPTHRVAARATHLYSRPDFKSPELTAISLLSEITVTGANGAFAGTPNGYVPERHLVPLARHFSDPVGIAALYLGTPYLWGGNSCFGVDCSGLVQAALHACGTGCPGDSDLQEKALGEALPGGSLAKRGDLMFWRGHVAMVADEATLIHANAHHMMVAHELIADAITRIEAQGGGPVTAHKRL